MTVEEFRRIALSMPEATEGEHMGHPDFRVKGKIFATLFRRDDVDWGMVKLKPDEQREIVKSTPDIFEPIRGGWGRQGCTQVRLAAADKTTVRSALAIAWRNTAPNRLVEEHRP
ncbi:MAG: MmcQ/YjbR family DNA-binding protein [Phycisphaerales bacterium]|nr:MmcQ/YjbR family DNA-binding protein [Phycisphaerales bacterium]